MKFITATAKMTWMFYWRLLFLLSVALYNPMGAYLFNPGFLFLISLGAAAIIAGVFKTTVYTFPLIRLIFRRPVIRGIDEMPDWKEREKFTQDYGSDDFYDEEVYFSRSDYTPSSSSDTFYNPPKIDRFEHVEPPSFSQRTPEVLSRASRKGKTSDYFDNQHLEKLPIPNTARMFGSPGAGLGSADQFGSGAVAAGQKGEENFAKILARVDENGSPYFAEDGSPRLLDLVYSFWSVGIPAEEGQKSYNTDVDCILLQNDKMMLVDLKYYLDGAVTYSQYKDLLYTVDHETSNWVGEPKKMTRNMEMALDRYRKQFPNHLIEAITILIPTNMGEGNITTNSQFTPKYPGDIPLLTISSGLNRISAHFHGDLGIEATHPSDIEELNQLLK